MEEDFFLKNMKGEKPFKKDASIIKTKTANKKNVKKDKKTNTKNTNKLTITEHKVSSSEFKLSFGEINKELKRGKINIDRRIDLHGYGLVEAHEQYKKKFFKINHSSSEKELLIEMIFQLGEKGVSKFKKMLYFLNKKQKLMASLEMLNSLWYLQTPERVKNLIKNYTKK